LVIFYIVEFYKYLLSLSFILKEFYCLVRFIFDRLNPYQFNCQAIIEYQFVGAVNFFYRVVLFSGSVPIFIDFHRVFKNVG